MSSARRFVETMFPNCGVVDLIGSERSGLPRSLRKQISLILLKRESLRAIHDRST